MKELKDAIAIILGDNALSYYIAGFAFSFMAILLSIYLHSTKRDKLSESTPYRFSWKFLLWDNAKRMVVGMIAMFIIFRIWDLSGSVPAQIGVGFFLAFGLDKVIQFLMDYTNVLQFLKTDREKFKK